MNLAANGMTVLALLGAAFPAYHLFKNRAKPGALYLLALCLTLVIYPFNLILLEGEAAVLLRFTVVSQVAPLYLLAVLAYLRFEPPHWQSVKHGIFAYMLVALAAPWASGDLFIDFASAQPHADIREYVYQHGPLVWVMKIASYAFVLVGCAAVMHRFNSSRSNRSHIVSLALFPLCTAVFDLLAVLIGFSTYHGVTVMQISGTVTLFALSYALMSEQMLVRVPVSRNTLMSYLREGICVIGEQGEIADCNEALASMIAIDTSRLLGKPASRVLPEPVLAQLDAFRRHNIVRDVEVELMNGKRYLSVSVSRVDDSRALVLSATDITERKLLLVDVSATAGELRHVNERLEEMSLTDPLTGLGNRRKLQNVLSEMQQEKDHGTIGLIMVDIDHFKAINDTHGHDAGDLVLTKLADSMREVCRDSDTLVRWGGEEFLVLMRDSDERKLHIAAERLRLHIRQSTTELPNGVALHVTASIGATNARSGQSAESALRQVDRLMYEAKQDGRDCVKWSGQAAVA